MLLILFAYIELFDEIHNDATVHLFLPYIQSESMLATLHRPWCSVYTTENQQMLPFRPYLVFKLSKTKINERMLLMYHT